MDIYRNKVILAPMVRANTLPMRLLSLKYGADLVYTEEIVDYAILKTTRVVNEELNTVDYVIGMSVIFRTTSAEKSRLIFQLGTSNAESALQAALKVQDDVSGIDINMGCPKNFSVKNGMGCALLRQPELIRDILTTLVKNIRVPITCKIRVLPEAEATENLVDLIESTGVSAIAIHGRYPTDERTGPCRCDLIASAGKKLKAIPLIANGGSGSLIKEWGDIEAFKALCGADSVMIARAALWNPSVFKSEGLLPVLEVAREFLKLAVDYSLSFQRTKYCLSGMIHHKASPHMEVARQLVLAVTFREICVVFGFEAYHDHVQLRRGVEPSTLMEPTLNEDEGVYELLVTLTKKDIKAGPTAKSILFDESAMKRKAPPIYNTVSKEGKFRTVVTYDGKMYASLNWSKNKRIAEQNSATVCLEVRKLTEE